MKLTPWMLTVAAFLMVAVLAVGFLFKKLTAREIVEAPRVESRTLPMAITEIEPGTVITRAHVGRGPWKADAELAPDTFVDLDGVIGRIAKEKITAAQPLRGSQFYAPGDHPDLKVAEGKRAVTINVGDDTAMVNGLIKPGQYVDVHMTVDRNGTDAARSRLVGADAMTLTLFEGVRVVAMNRSYTQSSVERGHNVTLELDEDQTRIMLLAEKEGTVALTFNPAGPGSGGVSIKSEQGRVTLKELLGIQVPEEKKPFMMESYRGSGHGVTYFEDGRRINYVGDNDNGGVGTPLQNNGSGSDWSTGVDRKATPDRSVTQQKVTGSKI
ncbi:MAG: Flp pilus assembly protein CpaB [Planctomyces sp.]|nr:Flp pilus assembly protein CpaB [Planctomyces sp.]